MDPELGLQLQRDARLRLRGRTGLGEVRGTFYLVDQVRERMDFVRTRQAIQEMTRRYPQVTAKLVEDKANGPAVIQSLRDHISGIIARTPTDSKLGRLNSVSPLFEAGKAVALPQCSERRSGRCLYSGARISASTTERHSAVLQAGGRESAGEEWELRDINHALLISRGTHIGNFAIL